MAIIGPEGGFTPDEIAAAKDNGFSTVSLGPRILKADTATLAVSTLLQYGYGDMRPSKTRPPPLPQEKSHIKFTIIIPAYCE